MALEVIRGLLGIGAFVLIAYVCSNSRKDINWRLVRNGLILQVVLGLVVLNPVMRGYLFTPVDNATQALLNYSKAGADFVMQSVEKHDALMYTDADGKPLAAARPQMVVGRTDPACKTFAFWILPSVVFFSCLMALLYYFGIMQPIIKVLAKVVQAVMGASASESLVTAANIFMGQTEAPLVIRPLVPTLTQSEMFTVMVSGFSHLAGGVMAMYAALLASVPGSAGHIVTACCMASPCAIVIAKILFPEREESPTMGDLKMTIEIRDQNAVEAAARGASEGMGLLINIVAMLIAFVALVKMADAATTTLLHVPFADLLGYLFFPLAWLMGIPAGECVLAGRLLGEKLVMTELMAYLHLSQPAVLAQLSVKTQIMLIYALAGFANFASIGIQIGGIGAMAPNRKADLAKLGFRAMLAGTLVTLVTGTLAGIFVTVMGTGQ